ncbi:MAG: GNAT family N-acetyltransferase [Pirellulaceae bacterium]
MPADFDLPTHATLTHCLSGMVEIAAITALPREVAKNGIDGQWWREIEKPRMPMVDEPDRHWEWRYIISIYQNNPYFRAFCLKTADEAVQAATIYRFDTMSAFISGKKAVHVERLATAPRNRANLTHSPRFRGCGTALMYHAIAFSYSLGYEGRVNLLPVANHAFYTSMGFEATYVTQDGDTLLEIPTKTARELLQSRGVIDG